MTLRYRLTGAMLALVVLAMASQVAAAPMDAEAHRLIQDIMVSDYAQGRHLAALENLQAAAAICEDGGCSKKVLHELQLAVAKVQAKLEHGAANSTPPPERIAIYVEGARSREARSAIVDSLPNTVSVVEDARYTRAAFRVGVRRLRSLMALQRQQRLHRLLMKANRATGADAVIVASVSGDALHVLYFDGGGVQADEQMALDADEIFDHLSAPLARLVNPPAPAAAVAPAVDDDASDTDTRRAPEATPGDADEAGYRPNDPSRAFFGAMAGFEVAMRDFSYVESEHNSDNLRPYQAFPALGFGVGAELYPGAMSGVAFVEDLGLVGSFHGVPSVPSNTDLDQRFNASSWAFDVGARYRIRTGKGWLPTLGLSGRFGMLTYGFAASDDSGEALMPELPEVSYRWLRAGIDARSQIDRFAIKLGLGYIGALASGPVYDNFNEASPTAVDMSAGVAVALVDGLETGFDVEYTRIAQRFESRDDDLFRASGSLDEIVRMRLAMAYAY